MIALLPVTMIATYIAVDKLYADDPVQGCSYDAGEERFADQGICV